MDCVFVVILFLGVLEESIGDPCTKSSFLPNLARRQTSTLLEYGQTALCDRYLVSRWYKADRSDMPTKPPQMWTCGTDNPIWLADPLPPNDGAEHVLKACIRGLFGQCFQIINIKVKNCGKYNVYYLKGTKACNQAYCFNTRKTKNAPNISVSSVVAEYSSLKWETYNKNIYIPHLTYKCTFKGDKDKKYCYQVDWYVDGTIVFENQVVKTEFAEISDNKFTNKGVYNLNTLIQCYVAVKFCGEDEVGEFTVSKGYFIGIKVTTPEIKIERQGKGVVKFKTTVPFACSFMEGHPSRKCLTYVQMINPPKTECGELITGSNRCNTVIEGYDSSWMKKYYSNGSWKKEYTMGIVHQDTMDYSSAGLRFIIRLESIGATGNMLVWENRADLPDIFVDVYEKKKSGIWKGKHCHGTGDPHMKNFDGRGFELQMDGEFIMYRNSEVKQEVQIKTTACSKNKVFCTCGVAARAGQDVFVINVCTGHKYANFFECGDGALTVYKLTEKKFEVIFPSGTTMKITLRIWTGTTLLDVHIYPFVNDVEKTSGLCGNLDGSNDQLDMQLRDKPTSFDINSCPNNFLNSWRPTANENLFSLKEKVYKNLESLSTSKIKLCICDLNSKSRLTDGPVETSDITCRSETYAECNKVKKKTMQCHVRITAKRRRRDLRNHIRRFKRQSSDLGDNSLPMTLTEQEARLKCETAMNKSTMYTMCMDKVVDLDQSFLQDCILDLKYTGQSEYINNALESALDSCKTITGKNVTLQRTSPEIAEEIMTSICPNNCSGNGDCYNGTCTCNEKFGGLDCSFDKYVAPIVDSLSDDGKCDRSDGTCEIITFYGNNFLEDTPTTCNIQRVEIDTSGNPSLNNSFTVAGEQISLFEANCPLDTVPNSFATKFKVSISNDGSIFTTEFDVHIYDSMCQEYDASRDTYLFKDGFCYIHGQCYQNGQVNLNQRCLNCNITDKGKFIWSLRSDFCLIEKQCYKEGKINPINTCDICDTHDKGALMWSENRNVCNVSGVCFKNGEVNPKNKCQMCNITDSGKDKWSSDNSACLIDRKCYQNGDIANDNPCFACYTKRNKTTWSIRDGFCYIDGLCLMDGQNNPMKPCLICDASNKNSWSHDTGFCLINDTCYVNYQVDPDDICRICYVSNTELKTDWSLSRACDNSYTDDETETTTEMEITTETMDLPTTLKTTLPTTTLQSPTTSTTTKEQLSTEASTLSATRTTTPTTEMSTSTTTPTIESSTSTATPITEVSTTTKVTSEVSTSTTTRTTTSTKTFTLTATPRTGESTLTTPTTIMSSSTTSEATSSAKSQIKTTSHQNEISSTTSSSVQSFSTTHKTHTKSAPIPETAEHTTSNVITIIVPIIVAVLSLVIIAIVSILVKRRRNITGGVTLKRLEVFNDGKMEAVYNPMYDKNKMEIDKSDSKDIEMTNIETTAEVLMSGASGDVSGSETMTPKEPN